MEFDVITISRSGTYDSLIFGSATDPSVTILSAAFRLIGNDKPMIIPKPIKDLTSHPDPLWVPVKIMTIRVMIDGYIIDDYDASGPSGSYAEAKLSDLWNIWESGEVANLVWRSVSTPFSGKFKITDVEVVDGAKDSEPTYDVLGLQKTRKYRVRISGMWVNTRS